jgi:hypothetical protein
MNLSQISSRTILAAGLTAAAVALTVSVRAPSNDIPGPPARVRVSTISASYPVYPSVRELAGESTVVVAGTVQRILPSYRVTPPTPHAAQLPARKQENLGFLMTEATVRVDRMLSGTGVTAGSTVRVAHLGGRQGDEEFVSENQDMSAAGRTYLFFLTQGSDGRYAITGGPQGRHPIRDGRISPDGQVATMPVARQLRGKNLTEVSAMAPPAK